jgi:hypothetical protein
VVAPRALGEVAADGEPVRALAEPGDGEEDGELERAERGVGQSFIL